MNIVLQQGCPNYSPRAKYGLPFSDHWSAQNSEDVVVYHACLYILSIICKPKKCLIIISPKDSITATIEGNVMGIIFHFSSFQLKFFIHGGPINQGWLLFRGPWMGELEIHNVLSHYAKYSVWPSPLLIVLYFALIAKTLDTPVL